MPIPGSELTKLRSNMHVVRPVVNYFPAQVVATATVSATPSIYPIGEVAVTWVSGMASVRVGQLFIITDGDGELVTYGVARKLPNSTTLYIDGKSRGDPGRSTRIATAITAGHTVTVYSFQPLWSLLSRIKDGKFLKQFDIIYTDEGSNPAPVCNIGSWRQAWADPVTGRATFVFNNDNSFAWLNKTFTASWTLPGSAVVTSGATNQLAVTFTLPEGFHIVYCDLTDSGGAVQHSWRPIWVNGPNFPPMSELYGMEFSSDSQDRKGRNISFNVIGDLDESTFIPGNAFHVNEMAYYDSQELSSGIAVTNYAGFSNEEQRKIDYINGLKSTGFTVSSPYAWFEKIPMVSQAIVEVASPSAWTDIAPTLGTPNFIAWYVLKHHTTYLDMFDYSPLPEADPPRKMNWGLNGSNISDYLNQMGNITGGNIGCISDGSLYIRRDPNLEDDGFRNSLDVRLTWKIDPANGICDLTDGPEINDTFFNDTGTLKVYALMFDGTNTTAYASIAPGYHQLQAPGSSDEDSYIVKPPGGQDKVNILAGHLLAKLNSRTKEVSLAINRNMDVTDPAKMLWHRLYIPPEWDPRNEGFNDVRVLPVSVERSWEEADNGSWIKNITIVANPESQGQPGETYNIESGSAATSSPDVPATLPEDSENIFDENGLLPLALAVNNNWRLGRSFDGRTWLDIQGTVVGKVGGVALDWFSPYPVSGFSEGNLGAWMIVATLHTSNYKNVQIYYTENILAREVVWTLQEQFLESFEVLGTLRIVSSKTIDGYVMAQSNSGSGIHCYRTTDGETWSFLAAGNSPVVTPWFTGYKCDLTLDGEKCISTGWDSTNNVWRMYYTPDKTSSFQQILNPENSGTPWPCVIADDQNHIVYATKVDESLTLTTTNWHAYVVDNASVADIQTAKQFPLVLNPAEFHFRLHNDSSNVTRVLDESVCDSAPPYFLWDGWKTTVLNDEVRFHASLEWEGEVTVDRAGLVIYFPDDTSLCGIVPSIAITCVVNLYNIDGELLSTYNTSCSGVDPDGYTVDTDVVIASGCAISKSANWTIAGVEKVSRVEFNLSHQGFSTNFPPMLIWDINVDTLDSTMQTPTTYRIENYDTGSPTWTAITPTAVDGHTYYPINPQAMAVDTLHPDRLAAIVKRPGSGGFYSNSTDNGNTWNVDDTTELPYYGLKVAGDYMLLFGLETLGFSMDAGTSYTTITGNWGTSIGSLGVFVDAAMIL